MPQLTFTNASTSNTLKLANTPFLNNTNNPVTLAGALGSKVVAVGANPRLALTVQTINYGAQTYYLSGNSYTASGTQTATLTVNGANLIVTLV